MGSETVNTLVIGGGGREHALCWKLAQSLRIRRLYCAPGNPGIANTAECVAIDSADHNAVIAFCRSHDIGLVVVGPEQPLVEGLVDSLDAAGIRAFGPSRAAAQLEGSKGFTKALCAANGIPTAGFATFTEAGAAEAYLASQPYPIVVKADGLAAGKGVVIAADKAEAEAAIDMMFGGGFGEAGASVVIEEFMAGEEASFFALVDGETAVALEGAQDHKRVGEGDTGPNTGGMGAYSPAPVLTEAMKARVMREIVEPTAKAMVAMGCPFRGVLFAGLMIGADGPKLIEYNARFGDPETQVLMARLDSDLLELLLAACDGTLASVTPKWRDDAALTVVMAAEGYPGTPLKGSVIRGVETAEAAGAIVFHAGTALHDGSLVANGGRVLAVTGIGASVTEAARAAYAGIDAIDWAGGFCRRDIGRRAIERETP